MAVAYAYGHAAVHLLTKDVSWSGDVIQAGLFSSSYTPDVDNHEFVSDLSGEVTDASYTRHTLTSTTVTYSATNNGAICGSDQLQWNTLTGTFRYVIFFKWTGSASTSALLSYIDYGGDQTVTASNWPVPLPTNGYLMLQV